MLKFFKFLSSLTVGQKTKKSRYKERYSLEFDPSRENKADNNKIKSDFDLLHEKIGYRYDEYGMIKIMHLLNGVCTIDMGQPYEIIKGIDENGKFIKKDIGEPIEIIKDDLIVVKKRDNELRVDISRNNKLYFSRSIFKEDQHSKVA